MRLSAGSTLRRRLLREALRTTIADSIRPLCDE
jgi:hypothetical protein